MSVKNYLDEYLKKGYKREAKKSLLILLHEHHLFPFPRKYVDLLRDGQVDGFIVNVFTNKKVLLYPTAKVRRMGSNDWEVDDTDNHYWVYDDGLELWVSNAHAGTIDSTTLWVKFKLRQTYLPESKQITDRTFYRMLKEMTKLGILERQKSTAWFRKEFKKKFHQNIGRIRYSIKGTSMEGLYQLNQIQELENRFLEKVRKSRSHAELYGVHIFCPDDDAQLVRSGSLVHLAMKLISEGKYLLERVYQIQRKRIPGEKNESECILLDSISTNYYPGPIENHYPTKPREALFRYPEGTPFDVLCQPLHEQIDQLIKKFIEEKRNGIRYYSAMPRVAKEKK
ncbi:MAG: hypothetical protein Q8O19_01315 [Rectinemataceae bacterium]|nr:hypothetical protein [Rectinemataceae bacterium]